MISDNFIIILLYAFYLYSCWGTFQNIHRLLNANTEIWLQHY